MQKIRKLSYHGIGKSFQPLRGGYCRIKYLYWPPCFFRKMLARFYTNYQHKIYLLWIRQVLLFLLQVFYCLSLEFFFSGIRRTTG